MSRADKQAGFTIIELLLAMAFIAVLLLAIAMTVLQIGSTYNRGLTMKALNQASRSINDELARGVASARSFSIDADAHRYVNNAAYGGRLCLGTYSYIWNYGKARVNNHPDLNTFRNDSTQISFVKVSDPSASYCLDPSLDIDPSGAVELLQSGDRNLAIHSFSMTTATTATDSKTGQQLYTVDFTIGTNDISALNTTQTACLPPAILGADVTYCSVQQFSIVLRTGNGVN
jgi:type II secretory pathway pseudopilin PulG